MIGEALWRDRLRGSRRGERLQYDAFGNEITNEGYLPGSGPPGAENQEGPPDGGGGGNGDGEQQPGGYQFTEPGEWGFGSDWLQNMLSTYGMPIDVEALYAPLRATGERKLEERWKDQKEMFGASGFGGGRWSSPLIQSGMREAERMEENLTLSMARAKIAAEEAGMSRAMGSINPYIGVGTQRFQAPYQANQWMLQSGLMEQELMSAQAQNQMNPWMAMLLNATAPGGVGPNTYQPGGNIWDLLSNMPWGDLFGGGQPNLNPNDIAGIPPDWDGFPR